MVDFNETVAALAKQPHKAAQLQSNMRRLPGPVTKTAATTSVMERLFGGAKGTGGQQVARSVASGVITAAITGTGALLLNRLEDKIDNPVMREAENKEYGKLNARTTFKTQQSAILAPRYKQVFNSLKKDEYLKDADKGLLESSYTTMRRFAPNLAADENAARSFLREHVVHGTAPGYATLKSLAESEKAITEAGGLGSE